MPLLVGGIYKGEKARSIVEKLCQDILGHVGTPYTVDNESLGYKIVAGCQDFESPEELIVPLDNNSSLLTGRLFAKDFTEFDPQELSVEAIKKTQGKFLGDSYWGRYLLITTDDKGITIYRDPQGLTPLFYMPIEGGYIFASRISFLYDALDKKPDLNWNYLSSFIAGNHALTAVTPFMDVQEVLPGCSTTLSIGKEPLISQFWDPTLYASPYKEDDSIFEEKLFDTVGHCSQAWIKGCTNIKVQLSGGLDSSSLVAIMKSNSPNMPMHAYNMYHSTIGSSDERAFAQDVAALYGVPISFLDSSNDLPFNQAFLEVRFDRPAAGKLSTKLSKELTCGRGEEMISGQGGDHLFFAGAPIEMVLDYYFDKGLRGILNKVQDLAAFHRMPFLQVFKRVMQLYVQHKRGSLEHVQLLNTTQPWIKDSFKEHIDESIFKPYFWKSLGSLPPGKAKQILAVLSATLYIDNGQALEKKRELYPLLAQPVVELALSIPSYKSLKNGYDRFMYRNAMDRYTKGKFIWRKSKGESSGSIILGLRKNFEQVRTLLLEGSFAQLGYVDTDLLDNALRQVKHGNIQPLWPILNLYAVEQWLYSWKL